MDFGDDIAQALELGPAYAIHSGKRQDGSKGDQPIVGIGLSPERIVRIRIDFQTIGQFRLLKPILGDWLSGASEVFPYSLGVSVSFVPDEPL